MHEFSFRLDIIQLEAFLKWMAQKLHSGIILKMKGWTLSYWNSAF